MSRIIDVNLNSIPVSSSVAAAVQSVTPLVIAQVDNTGTLFIVGGSNSDTGAIVYDHVISGTGYFTGGTTFIAPSTGSYRVTSGMLAQVNSGAAGDSGYFLHYLSVNGGLSHVQSGVQLRYDDDNSSYLNGESVVHLNAGDQLMNVGGLIYASPGFEVNSFGATVDTRFAQLQITKVL